MQTPANNPEQTETLNVAEILETIQLPAAITPMDGEFEQLYHRDCVDVVSETECDNKADFWRWPDPVCCHVCRNLSKCDNDELWLNEHMIRRCREMSVSDAIHDKCVPLEQFKRRGDAQLEDYTLCPLKEFPLLSLTCLTWQISDTLVFTGATTVPKLAWLHAVCVHTPVLVILTFYIWLIKTQLTITAYTHRSCMRHSRQSHLVCQQYTSHLTSHCVLRQSMWLKRTVGCCCSETWRRPHKDEFYGDLGTYHAWFRHRRRPVNSLCGENTIEHVLRGKAYARAVRAHIHIQAAFVQLLLQYLSNTTVAEVRTTQGVHEQTCSSGYSAFTECDSLSALVQQLKLIKFVLKQQSRTARLWKLTWTEESERVSSLLTAHQHN